MNKLLAMAVSVALVVGSGTALAQDRDGRRDGARDGQRGDRVDRADGSRGGDWSHRGDGNRGDRNGSRWDGHRNGSHWDGHRNGSHWDGHRNGSHWDGHRRGDHRGYGYGYGYPSYGYASPRSYGDYSRPYGYYYDATPYYSWAPGYVYSVPVERPIVIERVYEAAPLPYREYEERNYAQVTPREPAPRPSAPTPAQPSPRLERYTLSATELFEFDHATLRQPQAKLDEIAEVLRRNAQIDQVTITGYTDRLGTDAYNQKLSERRAGAVKAYLVGKGIESSRLRAIGKGKANPVVQCNDRDRAALIQCLEPNRRVEVEQITIERRVTPPAAPRGR